MNNSTNIFGERLKDLRTEKGLTQSELGKELGISRGAISYYEAGDRMPDINVLYDVAKYFNVSSDYLIGLSGNSTTDMSIKEISNRIGLSDTAIENMEILTRASKGKIENSYLHAIDWLLSEELNASIYKVKGDDLKKAATEIETSEYFTHDCFKGDDNEEYHLLCLGFGISVLKHLNSILFSSYIDFNPLYPVGYEGNGKFYVISRENAIFESNSSFSLVDTNGGIHYLDFETLTKAELLNLNEILSIIRENIKHTKKIKQDPPKEYTFVLDEQTNENFKLVKEQLSSEDIAE